MHKIRIFNHNELEYKRQKNLLSWSSFPKLRFPTAPGVFLSVLLTIHLCAFDSFSFPFAIHLVSLLQIFVSATSQKKPFVIMNTSVAIAFGLALVLVWCTSDTHGAVTGRCSGLAEHVDPENCVHGMVFDNCGRKVCAKGPGETCGIGMWASLGTCGEGMFCRCGRCIGCSLNTFECYDKTCIS